MLFGGLMSTVDQPRGPAMTCTVTNGQSPMYAPCSSTLHLFVQALLGEFQANTKGVHVFLHPLLLIIPTWYSYSKKKM